MTLNTHSNIGGILITSWLLHELLMPISLLSEVSLWYEIVISPWIVKHCVYIKRHLCGCIKCWHRKKKLNRIGRMEDSMVRATASSMFKENVFCQKIFFLNWNYKKGTITDWVILRHSGDFAIALCQFMNV